MTAVFLVCFIGGLLLAVRMMLYGVERRTADRRSIRYWIPVLTTFVTVFGVSGYLLARTGGRSDLSAALWAAVIGAGSAVLAAWAVARWARVVPEHDIDDERYVLQGHLARVVTAIDDKGRGEIAFQVEAEDRRLPARALDDVPVVAGTEVVIERIEDGIAYVEPWVHVEQRL